MQNALRGRPGVESAQVNFATGRATVVFDSGQGTTEELSGRCDAAVTDSPSGPG